MFVVCKKCGVEHDARDVNNGICVWCEQKENSETAALQSSQRILFNKRVDWKYKASYSRYNKRG